MSNKLPQTETCPDNTAEIPFGGMFTPEEIRARLKAQEEYDDEIGYEPGDDEEADAERWSEAGEGDYRERHAILRELEQYEADQAKRAEQAGQAGGLAVDSQLEK